MASFRNASLKVRNTLASLSVDDDKKVNDTWSSSATTSKDVDGAFDIRLEVNIDGEVKEAKEITRMNKKREMVIGRWYDKTSKTQTMIGHQLIVANYFSLTETGTLVVRSWTIEAFQNDNEKDEKNDGTIFLKIKGPCFDNDGHERVYTKYTCSEFVYVWMTMDDLIKMAKHVITTEMKKNYSLFWNNCRHFVDRMMDNLKKNQARSIKMSADQLTHYVKNFGSSDSTVKDNDKKSDSLDVEGGGKSISIQRALTDYPIAKYDDEIQNVNDEIQNVESNCVVM